MKYNQLDRSKKEELKIIIYNLREQGLSYTSIVETIEREGIKISLGTVSSVCKVIYTSKNKCTCL